jgi:hypothetical protein
MVIPRNDFEKYKDEYMRARALHEKALEMARRSTKSNKRKNNTSKTSKNTTKEN